MERGKDNRQPPYISIPEGNHPMHKGVGYYYSTINGKLRSAKPLKQNTPVLRYE